MKSNDSINYYKKIIRYLASDSLKGREPGNQEDLTAANFIYSEFLSSNKSKPNYQVFEFIHPYTKQKVNAKNVFLSIDNLEGKQTIVICAHYDHIGMGQYHSLGYNKKNQVYNGADDNASGVALMLSLYKNHEKWMSKKYDYLFVAYSGHELGLFGSSAFFDYIKDKIKPIRLVVNLDMVGRIDTNSKIVTIFSNLKNDSTLDLSLDNKLAIQFDKSEKIRETDAKIYNDNGIQAISITTGTHLDYHKPSDDEIYIQYQGIQWIQSYIEKILNQYI